MTSFVGRRDDLSRLTAHLDAVTATRRGRLLAVRGRRQVGKSSLLTRFVDHAAAASIYLTAAKDASPTEHLRDLSAAARTSPHPPTQLDLLEEPPLTWSDALQRLAALARDQPLIVVLDEYPWAAAAERTLDSRIQAAWDRTLEHLPLLMVLVGSDLAVMERTISHDAPLYGRARPFVVDPLSPADTREVLGPGTTALAALDTHLVTGGYPRLVQAAAGAGGALPLVRHSLLDPYAELVVTAALSLDAELPPNVPARAVLESVGHDAVGPAVFGTIVDRLAATDGTARAQVTRAVDTLRVKRLITIDTPAGSPTGTRLRRYRILDTYLRFWLRFVSGQLGDISRGRGDLAVAAFERGWQSWRGRAIEPIVRQSLLRAAPELPGLAGTDELGGWWNRTSHPEIDIVANAAARPVGVGTIKWREVQPLSRRDLRELSDAAATIGLPGDVMRIGVCPAGAEPGVDADLVWTAEDVMAATP